jgi:hypothetical protein
MFVVFYTTLTKQKTTRAETRGMLPYSNLCLIDSMNELTSS